MITCLFVLIIITALFLLFGCKKTSLVTLIIFIVSFVLIGNGSIATILLSKIQDPFEKFDTQKWQSKNAIVLLGGGAVKLPNGNIVQPMMAAYPRIHETANLYSKCIKSGNNCTIFISGGDALHTGESEAKVYQNALNDLGISNKDITLEPNSMNTYKNAEFTSEMLKKGDFNNIVLVTSGTHLKRSLLYFANFGINALPAPADYMTALPSLLPTGYNFAVTDLVVHEYIGILRLHVYNFLGWNKKSAS